MLWYHWEGLYITCDPLVTILKPQQTAKPHETSLLQVSDATSLHTLPSSCAGHTAVYCNCGALVSMSRLLLQPEGHTRIACAPLVTILKP